MPTSIITFASFVLKNGYLCPKMEIPVTDRGFRYGQHLFETIAVRAGKWHGYERHLFRLRQSAREALFQATPVNLDLLDSLPSYFDFQEGLVRLYWTAGDGAPSSLPAEGRLFLTLEPQALPAIPLVLKVMAYPRPISPFGQGWKTGNYWANVHAFHEAVACGFEEALLFNNEQCLVGACFANAVVRLGDDWVTPPVRDGARPGITRQWILEQGFAKEASIQKSQLDEISGLLLTNSRIGPCFCSYYGKKKLLTSDSYATDIEKRLWYRFFE